MTRAEKLEYIELLNEKHRRKIDDYPNQFNAGNFDFITALVGKKQKRRLVYLTSFQEK